MCPQLLIKKLWLFCALHRWRRSMQLQLFNLCKLHSLSGPAVAKETSILIDPTFSWCTKRIITYFDWSHYFMAKEKAVIRGHYRGWCWEQKIIFLNLVYSMLPTIICLCTGLSADSYCESTRYDYWSQFELCVFCSNPMHGSAFPQICHVSDTKSQCDTDTESQNQCWYIMWL